MAGLRPAPLWAALMWPRQPDLEVTSNLVVVRDAQNNPVENLKKEDFKLFDPGQAAIHLAVALFRSL